MPRNWMTKNGDLRVAADIIKKYLGTQQSNGSLGLFEITLSDGDEDTPDIRLSEWVVEMAEYFYQLYGKEQGDFVTQMVLSKCLTSGHTIH